MSIFSTVLNQAQRYVKRNPNKVRTLTDRAARFADGRTSGKYSQQINGAARKARDLAGAPDNQPGPQAETGRDVEGSGPEATDGEQPTR